MLLTLCYLHYATYIMLLTLCYLHYVTYVTSLAQLLFATKCVSTLSFYLFENLTLWQLEDWMFIILCKPTLYR